MNFGFVASCFECVRSRACVVFLCVSGPLRLSAVKSFQIKATRFKVQSVVRKGSRSALAFWYVLCVLRFSLRCCFGLSFVFLVCFSGWVILRLMPAVLFVGSSGVEWFTGQCVLRALVRACISGQPRSWQFSTALPDFRLCSFSLRVRSATSVICGFNAALNSSE